MCLTNWEKCTESFSAGVMWDFSKRKFYITDSEFVSKRKSVGVTSHQVIGIVLK